MCISGHSKDIVMKGVLGLRLHIDAELPLVDVATQPVQRANGKTISFVETETGTNYCIALSSDGKKIYIGPAGADISVYDAENLNLLKVIPLDADGAILHRLTI